jgi:hypothetical protein
MKSSKQLKTPWGLPVFFSREGYERADVLSTLSSFFIVPLLLRGEAFKFYSFVNAMHLLLMLSIDYEAIGSSLIKRWTGMSVAVPLTDMYCFDTFFIGFNLIAPFHLEGFSEISKNFIFLVNGVAALPFVFFVDFGEANIKKAKLTSK